MYKSMKTKLILIFTHTMLRNRYQIDSLQISVTKHSRGDKNC